MWTYFIIIEAQHNGVVDKKQNNLLGPFGLDCENLSCDKIEKYSPTLLYYYCFIKIRLGIWII